MPNSKMRHHIQRSIRAGLKHGLVVCRAKSGYISADDIDRLQKFMASSANVPIQHYVAWNSSDEVGILLLNIEVRSQLVESASRISEALLRQGVHAIGRGMAMYPIDGYTLDSLLIHARSEARATSDGLQGEESSTSERHPPVATAVIYRLDFSKRREHKAKSGQHANLYQRPASH